VEISSNNDYLFIAAYDLESNESFLIELPEKKAQLLLAQFSSKYDEIASNLTIVNKRLVLMNPVRPQATLLYHFFIDPF
jgi:hypothetical protein